MLGCAILGVRHGPQLPPHPIEFGQWYFLALKVCFETAVQDDRAEFCPSLHLNLHLAEADLLEVLLSFKLRL